MELCQPESLRDRLIHRKVNRPQAWLIFDQIIKGIEYIHSQKLVNSPGRVESQMCSMCVVLASSRFETIEYSLLAG